MNGIKRIAALMPAAVFAAASLPGASEITAGPALGAELDPCAPWVQASAMADGRAVIAAKLALEGADPAGGSLFFLNPSIAKSSWIQRNRTFFVRIGRREFYL